MSETASTTDKKVEAPPEEKEILRHDGTPWANKFKNPYELEKAYGESVKIYNEYKDLKTQYEVPSEYSVADDLALSHEDVVELKRIAKESNLTQTHFENVARKMSDNAIKTRESWEKKRAEVGDEKINLITDYVKRANYPEKLHDMLVNKIIEDADTMSEAFKHRDKLLNTQRPGIDAGSGLPSKPYDGQKELKEMIIENEKRDDPKRRDQIIKLAREIGHERFKAKTG